MENKWIIYDIYKSNMHPENGSLHAVIADTTAIVSSKTDVTENHIFYFLINFRIEKHPKINGGTYSIQHVWTNKTKLYQLYIFIGICKHLIRTKTTFIIHIKTWIFKC